MSEESFAITAVMLGVTVCVAIVSLAAVLVVLILRFPKQETTLASEIAQNTINAYERGRGDRGFERAQEVARASREGIPRGDFVDTTEDEPVKVGKY